MHFHNPTTFKDPIHSSAKGTKEIKGTREDSFNNADQGSVKDPPKRSITPPMLPNG